MRKGAAVGLSAKLTINGLILPCSCSLSGRERTSPELIVELLRVGLDVQPELRHVHVRFRLPFGVAASSADVRTRDPFAIAAIRGAPVVFRVGLHGALLEELLLRYLNGGDVRRTVGPLVRRRGRLQEASAEREGPRTQLRAHPLERRERLLRRSAGAHAEQLGAPEARVFTTNTRTLTNLYFQDQEAQ